MRAFHDRDCDLSIIRGKRVAVIGYGSQGPTHALNLRDSGVVDLVVGLRDDSPNAARARAEGLTVVGVAEAARHAEVLALMTSDEAHRDLWREALAPNLKDGAAVVFAHGLSVRFGLVEPGPGLDVILVSPKGIGPRIREIYEQGEGVYGLFAVHQDATGRARDIGLSYASALGCGRKAILETTFRDECETDLFGEQVVLCGGTMELVHAAVETLVEAGYPPEAAWFECFYELKLVVDLMLERGIAGAFAKISNTAEFGAYRVGPQIIGAPARQAMREALDQVQSGDFVRALMADYDKGFPSLLKSRAALAEHPIEATGRALSEIAAPAAIKPD